MAVRSQKANKLISTTLLFLLSQILYHHFISTSSPSLKIKQLRWTREFARTTDNVTILQGPTARLEGVVNPFAYLIHQMESLQAKKSSGPSSPNKANRKTGDKPGSAPSATQGQGGDKVEDKLLKEYGGRGTANLPTTLMFDHVSPATRLLEKRRQMFEVQEALNAQKDEFNRREDAYRRREDGLRRKDLELQESLIKFNKFLQENESKRSRALKRALDERKQQDAKDIEIRKLESQLKQILIDEHELKEKVEANIQYQDYLENVCQSMAKYFPEIQDILSRYSTLRDANQQLLASKEQDDNERDMKEKEYNLFRKGKENQLLNQNNEIAEMQIQLEKAVNLRSAIQKDIDKSQNEASDKTLTLGAVLSGVTNVLNRCEESFRNRHNKPMLENVVEKPPDNDDELRDEVDKTCLKLEEVAMFMVDFNEIKRMYADYVKATLEA
jgi:hypothetical protein